MYYKIPLDADLSQTSYRAMKLTEEAAYIEYNDGVIGEDWQEITEEELILVFGKNPFIPIQKLTESEQMQIETYLNSKFVADMAVLNA